MTAAQLVLLAILICTLALFIWGRLRYDVVALLALLSVTILGLVPASEAFSGFGHPAVVTVAAVLVVSRGLFNSGLVDLLAAWLSRFGDRVATQVAGVSSLVALVSGFMNNVGALALFLPATVRLARTSGHSPSRLLMPLAFGSLLGGLITLIGTPPNIIIATFRQNSAGEPFRMFDFTPVGAGVALAGLLFVVTVGWRLIPERKGSLSREELFEIEDYLIELRVPEDSKAVGKTIRELVETADSEVLVVALVRGQTRKAAPSPTQTLKEDDILLIEGDSEDIEAVVEKAGLEPAAAESPKEGEDKLTSDEVVVTEAVVTPDSRPEGGTATSLNLRRRYGINLLAVARRGARLKQRIGKIRFKAGDVLLLQGDADDLQEVISELGLLPLAERELRLGKPRRLILSLGTFAAAIVSAAAGLLPIQVTFVAAAVAMLLLQQISLRELYQSIDWPVIVLLGAMIPVGGALETTGAAQSAADQILRLAGGLWPGFALAILLVATMFLSDLVNNAAAAVLMAPIGIHVAQGLGVSPDPFLMAVAIGASCAFLTPIGHQSNTLVMGPGGYQFGDYWRMGLPLEAVIVAVAIPLIAIFWPW